MAKRHIKDEQGHLWDVWDVYPEMALELSYDRRSGGSRDAATGPRASVSLLDPELASGWLCFQSGGHRRRFAPVPPGWEVLPDGVLRVMLGVGRPVASISAAARATPAEATG